MSIAPIVTKQQVCALEDAIVSSGVEKIDLQYEHFFAPGVYGRVMHAPAGTVVIGKAHRTEHLCVLLKGRMKVTNSDGIVKEISAPLVFTVPGGSKKAAFVIEDASFMNIHPTDTTDIEQIEQKVIIPEQEYRTLINKQLDMEAVMKITEMQ